LWRECVLDPVEYRSWRQALKLRPAAVEIIDQIRTSPPARRAQSGYRKDLLKWRNAAMRSRLEPFKKFMRMLRSQLEESWLRRRRDFPTEPLRA
jgi:hypothetical protein